MCNISKLSKSYFRASRALKKEWINGIYLYIDLGNPTVKFYTKREKANKTGFLLMYLKLKWAFDLTSSSSSRRILDPSKNWYTPIVCDNKMHTYESFKANINQQNRVSK